MSTTDTATDTSSSDFEWTSENLKEWAEETAFDLAIKLVIAIVIWIIGTLIIWILGKILTRWIKRNQKKDAPQKVSTFIVRCLLVFLKLILWIIILGTIGLDIGGMATILAALVFAVGFAASSLILHVIAGLILLTTERIKPGDVVELNDDGDVFSVTAVDLMDTEFTSFTNVKVVIPNGDVLTAKIEILNAHQKRRCDLSLGISYDADIKTAKAIIEHTLRCHSKVIQNNEDYPFTIVVTSHGDSAISIAVRCWCKTDDLWSVYWDLMEEVKYQFDKHGIPIPFPQRDIHLYNEEAPPKPTQLDDIEFSDEEVETYASSSSSASEHGRHRHISKLVHRSPRSKRRGDDDDDKKKTTGKNSQKKASSGGKKSEKSAKKVSSSSEESPESSSSENETSTEASTSNSNSSSSSASSSPASTSDSSDPTSDSTSSSSDRRK